MKIIVDINHPANVHVLKNFIALMKDKGHDVLITATEKDVSLKLLDNYGLPYENLGSYGDTLLKKFLNLFVLDYRMLKIARKYKPDVFVGTHSIRAPHVSFLMRKKCFLVVDTEHEKEQILLYAPFATVICTPASYRRDLGKKQLRFNGFKELFYLHPHYFTPDPSVLAGTGIEPGERFIVLRFTSWEATHDIGQHGIEDKLGLIHELERYGRVLISSEGALAPEYEKYKISVPPEKIHHLLYYATLYIGEGGTMASEAALLGTNSILINTVAESCGVFHELHSYGLLWYTDNAAEGLEIAKELLQEPDAAARSKKKLQRLLEDKIDPARYLVWLVENYPESVDRLKADPGLEKQFR